MFCICLVCLQLERSDSHIKAHLTQMGVDAEYSSEHQLDALAMFAARPALALRVNLLCTRALMHLSRGALSEAQMAATEAVSQVS